MSFKDTKKRTPVSEVNSVKVNEIKNDSAKETAEPFVIESKSEEKKVEKPTHAPRQENKKTLPKIAKVIKPLVNIRKTPSLYGEILTTATVNASFKVDLEKSTSDFVCVIVDGIAGFIKADLVDVMDNPAYTAHTVKQI